MSSKVHVLGVGAIGKLVAHSLSGLPKPPQVVLLFHREGVLEAWKENGGKIELKRKSIVEPRSGFETELVTGRYQDRAGAQDSLIETLILTVKASQTVQALSSVAHRLRPDSTVVFLQNGMGIIDEVNASVFPDSSKRPAYIQGVVSHGVYSDSLSSVNHNGLGSIALGLVRGEKSGNGSENLEGSQHSSFAPSTRYILEALTRSAPLSAVGVLATDLLQAQLEKLAVNAVINPLTALFDCQNGELLNKPSVVHLMRLILSEASLVIKSLPELEGVPNIEKRFSAWSLEGMALNVGRVTAGNRSSMYRDVSNGKTSEIDYINGYIVRRGEELGITCLANYMVTEMIKSKQAIKTRRLRNLVPFES